MKVIFATILASALFFACEDKPSAVMSDTPTPETVMTPPPVEFADAKYIEIGKQGLANLSSGNISGWMSDFSDNAVYVWNNGDSLVGKAAISEYWTQRRTEIIQSLTFSNEVWLPIKVNQPQSVEQAGLWLLSWHKTDATYKTGKSMTQWIHTDFHFDSNDKIDRVIQYLDRASIAAAMAE